MIKIQELKEGDFVRVEENTVEREGTVIDISRDENMVCINNGVQDFWYPMEQIAPIPLTEKELFKLGFEKVRNRGRSEIYERAFQGFSSRSRQLY